MTEEVWVPQSLTDEAVDQNAPSKLEQTCISDPLIGIVHTKMKLAVINYLQWIVFFCRTQKQIFEELFFVCTEEVNGVQNFQAPKSTSI